MKQHNICDATEWMNECMRVNECVNEQQEHYSVQIRSGERGDEEFGWLQILVS